MKLAFLQLLMILALAVFAGTLMTQAQSTAATTPLFHVTTDPELSFSGATVTVTVSPLNFAASSTSFEWFRNNAKLTAASGKGKNQIVVTTDLPPATQTQLRVDIDPGPQFSSTTQTISIDTIPELNIPTDQIDAIKSDFDLETSSVSPNPNETVTVSVVTFAFDKQFASYRWYVNDVLERDASGTGRSEFQVPAGREGEIKTVRVDVTTPNGQFKSKSTTIQVASAPLYWWANTATPYWYRGKALPVLGSNIHVLVLPKTDVPLTYRWEFNNNFVQQSSGVDRQMFTYQATYPVKEQIAVTMRSSNGAFSKQVEIGIQPSEPRVSMYEVQPLRGIIFERALGTFVGSSGDPLDFSAIPFFFPLERLQDLVYSWSLNGKTITGTFTKPWFFTLTSNAGESSSNSLNVTITDPKKNGINALQSAVITLH